jgi:hypothetical protein
MIVWQGFDGIARARYRARFGRFVRDFGVAIAAWARAGDRALNRKSFIGNCLEFSHVRPIDCEYQMFAFSYRKNRASSCAFARSRVIDPRWLAENAVLERRLRVAVRGSV